jgi:hypothetical protein
MELCIKGDAASKDEQRVAVEAHVRARASEYLRAPSGVNTIVTLVRVESRATSRVYRFHLSAGTATLSLLVKAALPARPGMTGLRDSIWDDRPRIVPFADHTERYCLEFNALKHVEMHLSANPKSGVDTVRVFDVIPAARALVMEALERPTLRTLVVRQGRTVTVRRAGHVREACFNAGAWLRRYHGVAPGAAVEDVCATRDEVVAFNARLTEYLAQHSGATTFAEAVQRRVAAEALRALPPDLPLGLSHGDYAMRNILVAPNAVVAVIDMLGRHRMPVYRDVAGFLANLQYSWVPALAAGGVFYLPRRAAYTQEFLRGYFSAETVPAAALRLFHAQALLERWCSIVARAHRGAHYLFGTRCRVTKMAASRMFRSSISEVLNVPRLERRGLN